MDFEITKVPEQVTDETIFGAVGRTIARSTARATESVLGLPGDIAEGVLSLIGAGEEFLTGKREITPEKIDLSRGTLSLLNKGIKAFTGYESPLPDTISPPSSEDIKNYITKPVGKFLPNGTFQPQAEWEQLADSFITEAIPLMIPVKGKIPFARALKVSGLGNIASWLTKKLGGGEREAAATKLGTTLLTTFASPGIIKKYASTLIPKEAANFLDEVKNSSKILTTLGKYTGKAVNPVTGILLGAHYGKGTLSALGIGGLYGAGVAEKLLKAFAKEPGLRRYYTNILRGAAIQNAPLISKNIKKLDKAISKKFPIDTAEGTNDFVFEITKV